LPPIAPLCYSALGGISWPFRRNCSTFWFARKTPVKLTGDQRGLKCPSCHRVYPIREDIPVMLIDEARIEAE
jgi:uncharacterized protein YbaR (Trm112 family)